MITLVAFDLDGTLCDCTELHYQSLNKALKNAIHYEISREDHNNHFNGLPTKKKLDLLQSRDIINLKQKDNIWQMKQYYTKEMITSILQYNEQKVAMHQYLKQNNIKIACITNSIRETATLMLKTTGQYDYLDLLIANDDIKNPKPHPEGYIRAMVEFGSPPENVLIVEDAPVGLEAANATGANVWAVKDTTEVILPNLIKILDQYA